MTLEKVTNWNKSAFGQNAPKRAGKKVIRPDTVKRPTREELLDLLDQFTHADICRRLRVGKARLHDWIDAFGIQNHYGRRNPNMAEADRTSRWSMQWACRPMSKRRTGEQIEINGYRWSGQWRTI